MAGFSASTVIIGLAAHEAELAEIEENLLRRELDAATRSLLSARRVEIISQMEGGGKVEGKDPWGRYPSHGGTDKKVPGKRNRPKVPGSTAHVAAVEGRSKSSTARDLSRARKLGTETLVRVAGTSLGTGPELDALAKLPEPERQSVVERAQAGEAVSAVAILRPAPPPADMALERVWRYAAGW